jgi:putative ABC transport system ATP-binding protein
MIEIRDVRKVFNSGKPSEFVAVNGVSLSLDSNRIVVFRGPSGSGKTTLLSIIGCMARPSSGRVWLREREITSLPERFLTDIRRKTFGFVFQQLNLLKGIRVLENVMLPAYPLGLDHSSLKERATMLLDTFGLAKRAGSQIEWLSGGEAQRIAIARALINNPSVLIADEPTAHLDTALSKTFLDIVVALKNEGKTVLLTSHDPLVCDSEIVDRVVNLRDGKLV